jgi:hypothetical protein
MFRFELGFRLQGTVGGLTTLHPLAKRSLEMLGNPDAQTLMQIIAATGLMKFFRYPFISATEFRKATCVCICITCCFASRLMKGKC